MDRPNVLFLLCDQLRYDCVGRAGIRPVQTPCMDALADEGLFFENAYTPLPVCAPARQAMLTGMQPDSIGALFNYNFLKTNGADPAKPTWVSALRDSGYHCGFAGHWDASPHGSECDFGYESLFDTAAYNREIAAKYGSIDYTGSWFGCTSPLAHEDTKTYRICQSALDYIKKCGDEPWHVWVDMTDPHLPCRPSEPFASMYRPEDMEPWQGFGDTLENKPYVQRKQIENWHLTGFTWADFAPTVARYYAMITQTDAAISRIIDYLRTTGQLDNTLVILTADHGDTSGDHGMMDKHYILYDSVVHVPFIVRYPALGHTRISKFACNCLDLAPTIEDVCRLPQPDQPRDGRSVRAYTDGSETPEYAVFTSNGQQFGLFTQRGIRTERYKYIWNLTDIDELYDLAKDPGEKHNLAENAQYDGVKKELGALLFAELQRRRDPFANGWVGWQLGQ